MTSTAALAVLADASSAQVPVRLEVTATGVPEGEEERQMLTRRQRRAQERQQSQPDTDAEEQDENEDVGLDDGTDGGGRKRGLPPDARDEENSVEDSQGEFDSDDEEEEVGHRHKKKRTRTISIASFDEESDDSTEVSFDDDHNAFAVEDGDDVPMVEKKLRLQVAALSGRNKKLVKKIEKKDKTIQTQKTNLKKAETTISRLDDQIENELYSQKELDDLIKQRVAVIKNERISKTECDRRIAEAKRPITDQNTTLSKANKELESKYKTLERELRAKTKQCDDLLKRNQADKTKHDSAMATLQSKVTAFESDEADKKREHEMAVLKMKQDDEEKKHARQMELLDKKAANSKEAHEMKDSSSSTRMAFQQHRKEDEVRERQDRLAIAAGRADAARHSHTAAGGGGGAQFFTSTTGGFSHSAGAAPPAIQYQPRRRQQQQQVPAGNRTLQSAALGAFMVGGWCLYWRTCMYFSF